MSTRLRELAIAATALRVSAALILRRGGNFRGLSGETMAELVGQITDGKHDLRQIAAWLRGKGIKSCRCPLWRFSSLVSATFEETVLEITARALAAEERP